MSTRTSATTRALLRCGAAAGPLFLGVATVEGATRPGYDPLRHPISSLAIGPRGWRQVANFAASGALVLAGASGLARTRTLPRTVPALLAAVGAGLAGAGAFRTDPISGYPPGSPPAPDPATTAGRLHDVASTPVFLCLPAAAATTAVSALRPGERGWAAASGAAAAAHFAAFVAAGGGFAQRPRLVRWGGLFQRLSLAAGLGWFAALCTRAIGSAR
ncbi:DUF998 domain-containing protein [Pseudonocardia humida]|uniref:DUF998 domain-containing protein n=1 Tax=Pseudonocardia humida TaxID=2800819 RepID=A0ABT1A9J5_9PSEU|nr:DUF998 domain-containing protein [Pseudonocardia humida]MCO1659616.1 DUF998 domain-containing protein [Pseudonocardia humida]